ncbi:MAG: Ppx/GppA phosphatase family protein [Pseudomonadota bacterium]
MNDRSNRDGGQGTEPPQQGRSGRNSGKRWRKSKKRRQRPDNFGQAKLRQTVNADENAHPDRNREVSATAGNAENGDSMAGTDRGEGLATGHSSDHSTKDSSKRRLRRRVSRRPGRKDRSSADASDTHSNKESLGSHVGLSSGGKRPSGSVAHRSSKDRGNNRNEGWKKPHAYAALDLGTNNCRLLVAVPRQWGRFRVIDGFSRIVRLGEGLSQTGELGDAAMDRAVEALKICASKLGSRALRRQRLIATEACRQARNGQIFLDRVKAETGLELEVVNRETEARLAAEGCAALMDAKSDAAVMFDIGGGSTELILVEGRRRSRGSVTDRIVAWTSLPMGVVTLAERFGGKDVTREMFKQMVDAVLEEISRFEGRNKLDASFKSGYTHLLGTSGTVTTLAGMHLRLPRYDRRKVDGLWLKSEEIDSVIGELLSMNYSERAGNPCIGVERADLVLAGCAILEAIRKVWPTDRLRVADRGLREGLMAEMMNSDGVWRHSKRRRR